MYRQTLRLGALICFLYGMVCLSSAHAEQSTNECTLTMGWEPWHPYQYIDTQGVLTGFDIEFIEAIASSIGCSLVYREVNWARGLVDLKNGDLDLITNANYTQERSDWAHFSEPYRDSSIVIFMRKGESELYPFESLEDIIATDFRLGIGRGVTYSSELTEMSKLPKFKRHLVDIPTAEMQQYQMLQASRIDGFLRSITAMESLKEIVGSEINLEIHPFTIGGARLHVILSKKSVTTDLYARFNEGLRSIKNNGTLDSLLAKYF